jgi:16S rRNA processing protein RimM
MNRDDCFLLGKIARTTGLKGQVILHIDADNPGYYDYLKSVFVEQNKQLVSFSIESISIKSNGQAYTKFKDIDTVDQAEKLKNCQVFLPEEELDKLDDTSYYYHELPGLALCDENGLERATITNFIDTGMHYLAVVNYQGSEAYFPLNHQLFVRIDRKNKKILFHIPEGLLDIYTHPDEQVNDEQ